jgi:hypothetical protein
MSRPPQVINASQGVGVSGSCDASIAEAVERYRNPAVVQKTITDQNKSEYYDMIDSNNSLANDALTVESAYFISKYGKSIYKNLLRLRELYITPPTGHVQFDITNYSKAIENIHVLNQVTTIDKPLYNILDEYLPEYDSNSIYREVEYRNDEYVKLSNFNYYVNIFYYCLFIILILLLFSSEKLFLQERYMIYLFLAILPILYPWIFMLFRKIFLYIYPSLQFNGPTNAFVDTNTSTIAMFSNNVNNSYKKNEDTTTV